MFFGRRNLSSRASSAPEFHGSRNCSPRTSTPHHNLSRWVIVADWVEAPSTSPTTLLRQSTVLALQKHLLQPLLWCCCFAAACQVGGDACSFSVRWQSSDRGESLPVLTEDRSRGDVWVEFLETTRSCWLGSALALCCLKEPSLPTRARTEMCIGRPLRVSIRRNFCLPRLMSRWPPLAPSQVNSISPPSAPSTNPFKRHHSSFLGGFKSTKSPPPSATPNTTPTGSPYPARPRSPDVSRCSRNTR